MSSFNAERSFDVGNGFSVKGGSGWYSGSGSPLGCQAPLNSQYRDSDNTNVWKKTGPGVNDWTLETAAADPFALALFDDDCCPLFVKDQLGNVELLEDC